MDEQKETMTVPTEEIPKETTEEALPAENKQADEEKAPAEKPKKKKKGGKIAALVILLLFILLIAVLGSCLNAKLNEIDYDPGNETINGEFVDNEQFSEIHEEQAADFRSALQGWATNDGEKLYDKDIINILLIGSDSSREEAGRADNAEDGNTDVMMVVSLDQKNKKIRLISFMRDSYTYMHKYDRFAKLNAASQNGGPQYLIEVIENDYKIKIDKYALVDFDTFPEVIDTIGGVEMNLTQKEADWLVKRKCEGLHAGKNVLNGNDALQFSRIRYLYADGDVSRTNNQRKVINAIIGKCKSATPAQLNTVLDTLLSGVKTNYKKTEILLLGTKALTSGWASYEVESYVAPFEKARLGYNGSSWIWVIDYPLAAQQVQMTLYGKTNIVLEENRVTAIDMMKKKK